MIYAAFIITYKRPEILKNTISALLSQTVPPSRILIVDNDPDVSAKEISLFFPDVKISHFSPGANTGPAGGTYWGQKLLFEEGWEWVLWVDDDDPPSALNQIENILNISQLYTMPDEIGILGATGVLYNQSSCKIHRIPDDKLTGILDVDMIGGNQLSIINRRVYDAGVLPNPDLFFGFEELEFGLRVKQKGFKILVNANEVERLRRLYNKYGKEKPRGLKKKNSVLWREYYSIRTISFILRNNGHFMTILYFFLLNILKIISGFRHGISYGFVNLHYIFLGFFHGIKRKMGLVILPQKKY